MERFVTTYLELLRQSITPVSQEDTANAMQGSVGNSSSCTAMTIDPVLYEALRDILPQWVELMTCAAATEKKEEEKIKNKSKGGESTTATRQAHPSPSIKTVSSYLNADMAERYFSLAHHALIPTAWQDTRSSKTAMPSRSILPALQQSALDSSSDSAQLVLFRVLRWLSERNVVHHGLASCFLLRCEVQSAKAETMKKEAVKTDGKTAEGTIVDSTLSLKSLEQFVHDLLATLDVSTTVTLDGLQDALTHVCTRQTVVKLEETDMDSADSHNAASEVSCGVELRVWAELLYYAACEMACKAEAATSLHSDKTKKDKADAETMSPPAFVRPTLQSALLAALCRYFLLRVKQTLTQWQAQVNTKDSSSSVEVKRQNNNSNNTSASPGTLRIGTLCALALQHPMHVSNNTSFTMSAPSRRSRTTSEAFTKSSPIQQHRRTAVSTHTKSSRGITKRGCREPAFTPLPLRHMNEPRWRRSIVIDVDATGSSLNTQGSAEQPAQQKDTGQETRKRTRSATLGEDRNTALGDNEEVSETSDEAESDEGNTSRRHRLQTSVSSHSRSAAALWPRRRRQQRRRSRSAQKSDEEEEEEEDVVEEEELPELKASDRSLVHPFQTSLAHCVLTCYDITPTQQDTNHNNSTPDMSSAGEMSAAFPDLASSALRLERLRIAQPEKYARVGTLHWYLLADVSRHIAQLESAASTASSSLNALRDFPRMR